MFYTGIDPFTREQVYVAKGLRDRKMQRALLQFFKPETGSADPGGRADLIGGDCDSLIPAHPPQEALHKRREQADAAVRGDHVHTVPHPAKKRGYRPGRKNAGAANQTGPTASVEPQEVCVD